MPFGAWGTEKGYQVCGNITPLLDDTDPEIVTQAIKVLGDRRYSYIGAKLATIMDDTQEPRIKFYAAQALGRMKYKPAIPSLIKMIDANNDADFASATRAWFYQLYIGEQDPIVELTKAVSAIWRLPLPLCCADWKVKKFLCCWRIKMGTS